MKHLFQFLDLSPVITLLTKVYRLVGTQRPFGQFRPNQMVFEPAKWHSTISYYQTVQYHYQTVQYHYQTALYHTKWYCTITKRHYTIPNGTIPRPNGIVPLPNGIVPSPNGIVPARELHHHPVSDLHSVMSPLLTYSLCKGPSPTNTGLDNTDFFQLTI